MHVNKKELSELLDQLGLQLHYLAEKPIDSWDGYDRSNYRALQLKAGKVQRKFGIYDLTVSQKEVSRVTSPPGEFFDTYHLAQTALEDLVRSGTIRSGQTHILSVYITIK